VTARVAVMVRDVGHVAVSVAFVGGLHGCSLFHYCLHSLMVFQISQVVFLVLFPTSLL